MTYLCYRYKWRHKKEREGKEGNRRDGTSVKKRKRKIQRRLEKKDEIIRLGGGKCDRV